MFDACVTLFSLTTNPFSLPTDSSNATHDAAHLTLMNAQNRPQKYLQPQQETAKTGEGSNEEQERPAHRAEGEEETLLHQVWRQPLCTMPLNTPIPFCTENGGYMPRSNAKRLRPRPFNAEPHPSASLVALSMPKPHPTSAALLVTNSRCYYSPGAPYVPHPSLLTSHHSPQSPFTPVTIHPLFLSTRVRGSCPVCRHLERPHTHNHHPSLQTTTPPK